ncbi:hypothetical protein JDV02_002199 [Purpureocillium takamizusanense]|uniref:Uncharacterized protein n=1 Tax=Purpureocillium takamizusanense TaxID=2060973 RepID=A0A9Q8QAK9_9HYPO|nr:uncharacterized protein JDV02_002199 [Purpureocillium takamizusanense]UNI15688.1 hypothetical protein JDV02_002199 [Purpureocillium takamizusanense]
MSSICVPVSPPQSSSLLHRLPVVSPLESLPGELLDMIMDWFMDQAFVLGNGQRSRAKARCFASRAVLRNLCLASKLLCKHARPGLYRHVVLLGGRDMALLLGTLLNNPRLGLSVRGFVCLADASDVCTSDFSLRTNNAGGLDFRQYQPLAALADVIDAEWQQRIHLDGETAPYLLLMDTLIALLWLVPNAERVCFPLPAERRLFHQSRAGPVLLSLFYSDRQVPLLQHVTHAQIWPHGRAPHDYLDLGQCGPVLGALPRLETLELADDDGDFGDFPAAGSHFHYSGPIRHLILHQSSCTPCDVFDICLRLPDLQTLSVTTDADAATFSLYPVWDANHGPGGLRSPSNCLNNGLPLLKDTLTSLHLQLDYNSPVAPLIGPAGKLTCLPAMSILSVLSIGVLQLYTWEEMMTPDSPRNKLASVLPASLTIFRLHIDRALRLSQQKAWYGTLVRTLNDLASDVKSVLPHIGTIVVVLSGPYLEMYCSEFASLTRVFAATGVRFSCETGE